MQDIEVFCIPAFLLLAVLLAVGLDFVLKVLFGLSQRAGRGWAGAGYVVPGLVALALLLPLPLRWLQEDRSHDWAVYDLGRAWLQAPAQNGAVTGILGETVLMRYFQVAEGLRPDVQLYPADDEHVRLDTVRWLLSKGEPTYLTRPLTGVAEEFALDAAGPLVRVSSAAEAPPSDGYGQPLLSGFNLLGWQWSGGEDHGRAYIAERVTWLVTQTPTRSLKVSARAMRGGEVIASLDTVPVHNAYPTTDWKTDAGDPVRVVEDYYRIDLPVGDSGGPTDLVLVLYDADSGAELARRSLGSSQAPASSGPRPESEWHLRPLAVWLGGHRLLGTNLQPLLQANAGDTVPIQLLWANDAAASSGAMRPTLVLELNRQVVLRQPLDLSYSDWQSGGYLRQSAHAVAARPDGARALSAAAGGACTDRPCSSRAGRRSPVAPCWRWLTSKPAAERCRHRGLSMPPQSR